MHGVCTCSKSLEVSTLCTVTGAECRTRQITSSATDVQLHYRASHVPSAATSTLSMQNSAGHAARSSAGALEPNPYRSEPRASVPSQPSVHRRLPPPYSKITHAKEDSPTANCKVIPCLRDDTQPDNRISDLTNNSLWSYYRIC